MSVTLFSLDVITIENNLHGRGIQSTACGELKRCFTKTVAWPNGNVSSEVKQCPLAFLLTTDFAEPLKCKYASVFPSEAETT